MRREEEDSKMVVVEEKERSDDVEASIEADAVQALLGTGPAGTEVKAKPKRRVHKLTEEMLMGDDGFPKLIRQAKHFKARSNPVCNLADL